MCYRESKDDHVDGDETEDGEGVVLQREDRGLLRQVLEVKGGEVAHRCGVDAPGDAA